MKAIIISGIIEGYFHSNEDCDFEKVIEKIKDISNTIEESTGVYISTVTTQSKVTYKTEWGCPQGGEDVLRIESSHNHEFSSLEKWKIAILDFAKEIKKEFKQLTITIEFVNSELNYIK